MRGDPGHESQGTVAYREAVASIRGVRTRGLRTGAVIRHSGLFFSGLAGLSGGRTAAHGGFSMATVANSDCDRGSHSDVSEPDGADYTRAVARLLPIAGRRL